MPLYTRLEIEHLPRNQLEVLVEDIRARRMMATIEYHSGVNAKLDKQISVISRRLKGEYDMLAKELTSAEKAIEKLDKRLVKIDALKQERSLHEDMKALPDADDLESAD